MHLKKLVLVLLSAVLLVLLSADSRALAKNRGDYQLKKTERVQVITTGVWTDLKFDNGNSLKRKKNYRTLFCTKLHLTMPAKDANNPAYIKIRYARHLPNGTLDTTGTNTWVIGKNFTGATFHAALCWNMDTPYPITAQVKIAGKLKRYSSNLREFKAWSPPYELPADMVTPAPR